MATGVRRTRWRPGATSHKTQRASKGVELMQSTRSARVLLAALCLTAALTTVASAQDDTPPFPNKPIRIVVVFAAGGGNDLVARTVGPKLSDILGQPVIIENKPGANGQLGVIYAQSQP